MGRSQGWSTIRKLCDASGLPPCVNTNAMDVETMCRKLVPENGNVVGQKSKKSKIYEVLGVEAEVMAAFGSRQGDRSGAGVPQRLIFVAACMKKYTGMSSGGVQADALACPCGRGETQRRQHGGKMKAKSQLFGVKGRS